MANSKAIAILTFGVASLMTACNSLFYHPDSQVYITPDKMNIRYDNLEISTLDKSSHLSAWRLHSSLKPAKATIVHFHGNAQNMTAHVLYVAWLTQLGFDVITFDYRGYGATVGAPSREKLYEDAQAVLAYVARSDDAVIILGQSLGGAVVIPALAQFLSSISLPKSKQIKALIIDSSFNSYRRLARRKLSQFWLTWPLQWPLSFLISDELSPRDYVRQLNNIPTLLLHGDQDQVIPLVEATELAEAFENKDFWILPGLGHTQALTEVENKIHQQRIVEWIFRQL